MHPGDDGVGRTRNRGADDRSHPEQPQLTRRAVAVEERHTGRSSRVDRGAVGRDGDEVNQGQAQPGGNETRLAARDQLEEAAGDQAGENLRADVCRSVPPLEPTGGYPTSRMRVRAVTQWRRAGARCA
jgi:hypothetical protein